MAEEGKGVALAILGIVAVLAVVGLVLLFKGATGKVAGTVGDKLYGGGGIAHDKDQYQDPEGFVRYSDNRVYSGALYVYPDRIKDSGNGVPEATYDQDYRRTGPIMDNPCPYPPYTDRVTALYASGRECVPSGMNPTNGEMGRIPKGYEDYLCCI